MSQMAETITLKTKRSNSTLKGLLGSTLKMAGRGDKEGRGEDSRGEEARQTQEETYLEDTDTPEQLPILRGTSQNRKKHAPPNKEKEKMVSTEGRMKYTDMLTVLQCRHCSTTCTPPLVQCRKGHMYCRSCKADNKIVQCNVCKQTFVDAPNIALEQLVRLIAIPCKFGSRGCTEYVFLDTRLTHETLCKFRPVHCQYEKHGCNAVFSMKDMCWHHKMCSYANYPHPNVVVLPSMPSRKKSTKAGSGGGDGGGGAASNGNIVVNGEVTAAATVTGTTETVASC